MRPRTLLLSASIAAGMFVSCLVGSLVWLYASEPRSGPFDASFSLSDDRGRPVDKSVFHGRPALVYFGYTNCPEVCPTMLLEVTDWLQTFGPEGKDLAAYFFSVDPERDTPAIMHDYVSAFGDRIVGVTGRPEEMRKVMDGWMIRAEKVPSEDGNYHMSHTITLLMIGADGRLKGLIPYGTDREAAISKIRAVLLKKGLGSA
ncbi:MULTISPECIES: SCO family protein [unclassified Rhizobium]|uniref:SCO family protein n=1 Tax=unclassified Rhizobium TaxID=2613769 RepID=UPI001ADBB985|nr:MULTISPECIES: SCO family protein [unclassified Rhizobium]MBO9100490.1 SCO family protein [Rhizobium sp. L58/93]MBO9136148.1 SCO family protein [Rhizobium sp. B209b/85]MBO9171459.1 SCO family protein [Rhizobium sp. L245/93]MBO9187326.1 SCO family protein [Rhizobium sp. E27B/91]QXZ87999.1 SCO family protein [Rhizobium sp. K1/93]